MFPHNCKSRILVFLVCQRRVSSEAVSVSSSNTTLLNGENRSFCRFQYPGFQFLKRRVHNFSSEDEFSELGPPVAGNYATQLKLATEKPEPFLKTDPLGKASASRRGLSDIYLELHRTSQSSNAKFQNCHEVDPKNSESRVRELQNHPLNAIRMVTIRIQGIGKDTTDPMIHTICKSFGALEGFARADEDSVDALFRVTDGIDARGLVRRLNNVVINDCHWSACQISRDASSTALSESEEVGSKLVLQINRRLAEFKQELDYKRVYFEDLEYLHMEILHLKGLPTVRSAFDED